jgi:Family of unknown function (DUF6152)
MRTFWHVATAALFSLILGTLPALAHHSADAEFDMNRTLEVKGVLSKVEYENPHCFYYIDVKGADGKVTTWSFEGQPPSFMHRRGITREFILSLIGTTVSMSSSPAKDGTRNFGLGRNLTLADGRQIFLWLT